MVPRTGTYPFLLTAPHLAVEYNRRSPSRLHCSISTSCPCFMLQHDANAGLPSSERCRSRQLATISRPPSYCWFTRSHGAAARSRFQSKNFLLCLHALALRLR
ncbi:hypothetical protein BAUCODRAFT_354435 [Baudoinia panamericana UAMH 10762]|uniref:Uncharacterized protein n=1 Tax=Baudoinia panamericana (strain UAMH 10762) TaxID=717646 RepID=M2MSP6_BAUPA|nr:uncharacterized protein BAUCODRAFT_354435 [Baudoinia panamericana UAMH 10762]EMC99901.1 hypothetical protein BAUCODRAFT_354435 [Baudoinia panamericana UAMH 10762]